MKLVKLAYLADVILAAFYREFISDGEKYVFEKWIAEVLQKKVSTNLISKAVEKLYHSELIGLQLGRGYFITTKGVDYIDQQLDKNLLDAIVNKSPAVALHSLGADKLTDGGQVHLPASDRTVTLDHNKLEYKEAVSALDKVIAEFRADRLLGNKLGTEKGALLKTLEGGQELLKDTQVRIDSVLSLIINPLKILVARYEKEIIGGTIGALATAAITAIMKLFGLG